MPPDNETPAQTMARVSREIRSSAGPTIGGGYQADIGVSSGPLSGGVFAAGAPVSGQPQAAGANVGVGPLSAQFVQPTFKGAQPSYGVGFNPDEYFGANVMKTPQGMQYGVRAGPVSASYNPTRKDLSIMGGFERRFADGGPVLTSKRIASSFVPPEEQGAVSPSMEGVMEGAAAVGRGLGPALQATGEYITSTRPGQVLSDVGTLAGGMYEAAKQNPAEFIGGMLPGIGNIYSLRDIDELKAKIATARAAGDEETALKLEKFAPLAAVGAAAPFGAGAAVGAVTKAAERAAVKGAARELSPIGLYSYGAEAASMLPQAKGTPEQIASMLTKQGVKPEEMFSSGFADEAATNALRSKIESEFTPKVEAAKQAMEGLEPGTPEFKAAERQFKNVSSTMRAEMDRALVLSKDVAERPSLTREEAAAFFKERMPIVEEKVLGAKQPFDQKRLSELEAEYAALKEHPIDAPSFGEDKYDEMIKLMNIRDQSSTTSLYNAAEEATRKGQLAQRRGDNEAAERYFRESELFNIRAEKLDLQGLGNDYPAKFGQYTLPGGENYREVLLKMPDELSALRIKIYEAKELRTKAVDDYAKAAPGSPEAAEAQSRIMQYTKAHNDLIDQRGALPKEFTSGHWTDPNVLAHIRMSDRTGPNGEKILHVEEIQSDWAQKGRKEGFKEPGEPSGLSADETARFRELTNIPQIRRTPAQQTELDALNATGDRRLKAPPSAPYVTSTQGWTDLALKRVLKEAAEGGYDKVVWTPGVEQAARYDLSKQISRLVLEEGADGNQLLRAYSPSGDQVISKTIADPQKELPDLIGKEVSEKLLSQDPLMPKRFSETLTSSDISVVPKENRYQISAPWGWSTHVGKGTVGSEKEAAEYAANYFNKLAKEANNNLEYQGSKVRALEGQQLSVGGEGMKGYYDKIVPTQLAKLTKKLDPEVKVGMTDVLLPPSGKKGSNNPPIEAPGITITPKMREAIMQGLPSYAEGGEVEAPEAEESKQAEIKECLIDLRAAAKERKVYRPKLAYLIRQMGGADHSRSQILANNLINDDLDDLVQRLENQPRAVSMIKKLTEKID